MSLHRTRPNEFRTPDFIELPDGRKRLVRYFDLPNGTNLTDALVEAYGTADVGPATGTTAGFADLRLVDQRLVKIGEASVYQKTYEELPATAELQVGGATVGNTKIQLPDGRTQIEAEFLQLIAGTYTPGTVGTTTAPGDASAYLQREEMVSDGTLRRIKRTYVYAGQIAQSDETKNNGGLLLRTITSVKTVPATPGGYTLIAERAEPNAGLPIYTYTFAKGAGEISRDIDYSQSSDQGTTGVTRTTIRHLVVPAATVQPTSLSGSVEIGRSVQELDGHRVWTTVWAKGTGEVSRQTSTANNGALQRISITHLTASSVTSQPTSDPLSGGTVIAESHREAEGHRLWEVTWAKGTGEISRDIDYAQSSDQGTTGVTRTTIRYLVAPAATVQPTTLSGSVEIGRSVQELDGHRVWTTVWAKGAGLVSNRVEKKNGDKLRIYHRIALGSVPSAPTGGDTLGGTVTLIGDTSREEAGFVIYERTWAEGVGVIGESREVRAGGLVIVAKDILTAPGTTDISAYAPSGILLEKAYQDLDGYRRFSTSWMQSGSGADPTSGTAASYQGYVPFTYPGRAKYFELSYSTGGYTSHRAHDVYLSPPVETRVLATTVITYKSTATVSASYTIWNPSEWATLRAKWIGWSNTPRSRVEGLRGYRAVNSGASGTDATGGIGTSLFGDRVYSATDWAIDLAGGPGDPGGNTYTLHVELEPAFAGADGTQYYRQLEIYASIAAQGTLPV